MTDDVIINGLTKLYMKKEHGINKDGRQPTQCWMQERDASLCKSIFKKGGPEMAKMVA